MSGSTEPRTALVSHEELGVIMGLIYLMGDVIGMDELMHAFAQTEEVVMWVAQYSQSIHEEQMVCSHPQQVIDLQRQMTHLQTKQFLPQLCDHTE